MKDDGYKYKYRLFMRQRKDNNTNCSLHTRELFELVGLTPPAHSCKGPGQPEEKRRSWNGGALSNKANHSALVFFEYDVMSVLFESK